MASKEKFVEPMKKSYSVKKLLNGDSLQEALHGIRNIQTMLWETMPDEHYEQVERHFDVAIASMMAHLIGVPVEDPREDEYMEELENNNSVQITDGQTFYAFWFKPIKSVKVTVKAPVCGTKVATTESDEMSGGRPVVSQTGAPEFTVPAHTSKSKLMGQESYWMASLPKTPIDMNFFNGNIEGGKKYLVMFGINYDFGYFFTEDTVVKVNGADPEMVLSTAGLLVFANVKAEHNWGAWKVTKKASDKATGTYKRVCKADKKHSQTKTIAKVKLGRPVRKSMGYYSKRELTLTWKKVKGATSYKVYYKKATAKKWSTKTTTKTKYKIKKLKNNNLYMISIT